MFVGRLRVPTAEAYSTFGEFSETGGNTGGTRVKAAWPVQPAVCIHITRTCLLLYTENFLLIRCNTLCGKSCDRVNNSSV